MRISRNSMLLLCLPALVAGCSAVPDKGETQVPVDSREKVSGSDLDEPDRQVEEECAWPAAVEQPRWYHQATGYEIFVRSFMDSDGDGTGDLSGLISRLDYLNDGNPETDTDLGVDLLWLMPISPSPSYHGYNVTDYKGVNPDYGTLEDFDAFMAEAHKRGIRVVVDYVMNHSSSQHPWFLDSAKSISGKRDWYVWSDEALTWARPFGGKANAWHKHDSGWYYGIFWSGMPDLNYATEAVRTEMTDIGRFWLEEREVDGFRLDAVRYLVESGPQGLQDTPETMALWIEFSQAMYSQNSEALLVGEAWASNEIAARYMGQGNGLNMTFNFDLMEAVVAGVQAEDATDVEGVFCRSGNQFPKDGANGTFLTNHDLLRLASRLKEDPALVRLAAELLFVLPGTPFVYYGQEIGMVNGPTLDDKHKRTPMQWDDSPHAGFTTGKPWLKVNSNYQSVNVGAQVEKEDSLWSLYRQLIALRKSHPALSLGDFLPTPAASSTTDDLWAFCRGHGEEKLVVVVNLGNASAPGVQVTLPGGWGAVAGRVFPSPETDMAVSGDVLLAGDLSPASLAVFSVR